MLPYRRTLKALARQLRRDMTDAEHCLWARLRRGQLCGVPFYRQKPLGGYIADFYCAAARLVIELDGGQHAEPVAQDRDRQRTEVLQAMGLTVLRFDNRQVLTEIDAVVAQIEQVVRGRLALNPPPAPCACARTPLSSNPSTVLPYHQTRQSPPPGGGLPRTARRDAGAVSGTAGPGCVAIRSQLAGIEREPL